MASLNEAAECKRQGHLPDQLQVLGNRVTSLSDTVDKLAVRLESVLRPDSPEKNGISPTAPDDQLVPAATVIRSAHRQLDGVRRRLDNLIDRLEV